MKKDKVKFHQHVWRMSDVAPGHVMCNRCGRVTFNPWWPLWREAPRYKTAIVLPKSYRHWR